MEEVDYSLYDVNGNRYDVRVTQREADMYEKYPARMYAKVLQLKKEGKQPYKPATKQPTKRKPPKKKTEMSSLPSPIQLFKPMFNSTMNPSNTAAPQDSDNLFQSPVSKKVCEGGPGELDEAAGKSAPRRQLSYDDIKSTGQVNSSFKQFDWLDGALTSDIEVDQILDETTLVGDDAGASGNSGNSSPERRERVQEKKDATDEQLNTSFELLNFGNSGVKEDTYSEQTLVGTKSPVTKCNQRTAVGPERLKSITNVGAKSEAEVKKDQTVAKSPVVLNPHQKRAVATESEKSKLQQYIYEESHLDANQSPVKSPDSKSSMLFSNKVTVLGLEEGFQNSVLLYFINFAMKDLCHDKPAIKCRALDTTSAEVEFTSVQAAATSCLLDIKYAHNNIKLEQKITHTNTNKVKVTGLEEDFDPSVLLFLLNMSLTDNPALKCDRTGSTSAVVELTSGDAAVACCKLNLQYGRKDKITIELCSMADTDGQPTDEVINGQTVDLKHNENDISHKVYKSGVDLTHDSDEEQISESLIKDSDFVKVSGFDFTDADQDRFLSHLHARMQEAGFISEGEKLVNTVTVSSDSALILKLRTCEEANLACLLEKVYYLGNKLEIKKHAVDEDNNVIPVTETKATSSQMDVYDGEGYFIFAQMLIKNRDIFPKTGSYDVIFASIKKKLTRRGVVCSVADLRIKRDRMKKLFNKKKKYGLLTHEFYIPGTVIFENADVSLVKGTNYDPAFLGSDNSSDEEGSGGSGYEEPDGSDDSSDADDLLKFSKVATWSTDAAIDLVDTLIDNADDFYKPKRRKRFWLKVQRCMTKKKRFYTGKQCQTKAEVLKAALKDYNEGMTGDAGPMFKQENHKLKTLMDKVAELHHGSVAINPKVVHAAGLKAHEMHCNESTSGSDGTARSGRARPNLMSKKRPTTKAELDERRVAALELKAKALDRWSRKHCPNVSEEEDDM